MRAYIGRVRKDGRHPVEMVFSQKTITKLVPTEELETVVAMADNKSECEAYIKSYKARR